MAPSALVLVGPPGAGKTTALWALSGVLQSEQVTHAVLETEALSQGWPLLPAAAWVEQMACVIAMQVNEGRRLFLLTATVERDEELQLLLAALRRKRIALEPTVVCITANAATVAQRVADREPDSWPGKDRLVALARRLADDVPRFRGIDLVIRTDEDGHGPRAVARELRALLR